MNDMKFTPIEKTVMFQLDNCFPIGKTGKSFERLVYSVFHNSAWNPENRRLVSVALNRLTRRGLIFHVPQSMTAAGCPALWILQDKTIAYKSGGAA